MKNTKKLLVAAVAAACSMSAVADNHESDGNYMLTMTEIGVTMGHGMEFRQGMMAYKECYAENDGENSWTVWWPVDGKLNEVTIVSRMDAWGEMDSDDAASQECWSVIQEQVWPHMDTVERNFARRMADWSGEASGFSVVRLHNFRVEDGDAFREVVGEMTGMMKEAEYEHMGTWYNAIGGGPWDRDYFVVEHFADFADMDKDRKGANGVMVDAIGEEGAAAMWDRFGETLSNNGYSSYMLRRDDELGYSAE